MAEGGNTEALFSMVSFHDMNSPMQNEPLIWRTEPAVEIEIQSARNTSPSLSLAEVWACHRKMRIALASPRRQSCRASRTMIGRLRVGEPAEAVAGQAVDRNRPGTRLS